MPEAPRVARKLSTLQRMGFERVEASPMVMEAVAVDRGMRRVTATRPAMGTLVSATVLSSSEDKASEALSRAFAEMDSLIAIFTRYGGSSAVAHLNATGRLIDAPQELGDVISEALSFSRQTRGAFDITVAPVVDLLRAGRESSAPSATEIAEALSLVGSHHVGMKRGRIELARPGMAITLDGIAKGRIVDAMAMVLERHWIKDFLIDAGGDIRTVGTREDKRPWVVAVQDPAKAGAFPDTIALSGGAVATSGDYEIYFDPDRDRHHIVDAGTGLSPRFNSSVSVIAPTAMAADALATSVFLMEPRAGLAFIERLPGCDCLILERDGTSWRTRGWRSIGPRSMEGDG